LRVEDLIEHCNSKHPSSAKQCYQYSSLAEECDNLLSLEFDKPNSPMPADGVDYLRDDQNYIQTLVAAPAPTRHDQMIAAASESDDPNAMLVDISSATQTMEAAQAPAPHSSGEMFAAASSSDDSAVMPGKGYLATPAAGVSPNKQTECAVCFEKGVDAVFDPCGHMVCCVDCSKKFEECPVCRSVINKTIKVFGSL